MSNTGKAKSADKLAAARNRLMDQGIIESEVPSDPFELFDEWLSFAFEVEIFNANAMALATVGDDGRPSVRNVLARPVPNDTGQITPAHRAGAVAFYTDANSHKARDLSSNPNAAAVFSWLALERQVRMDGRVTALSAKAVANYFADRPREAQIAMLCSQQSERAANRGAIERRFIEAQSAELEINHHWTGYALHPQRVEFWQGRSDRIHDRLVYELHTSPAQSEPTWQLSRLQP